MTAQERIKGLVKMLSVHDKLYNENHPMITDAEYDRMYFELQELEKETNFILPNSPTQKITYEVVNNLPKVKHSHPMLSLNKTQSVADVAKYFAGHDYIAMAKMDGLTCSLTYEGGQLVRAETRGDGEIGEDITHNAKVLPSIPQSISIKERVVIDGEVICKYCDFKTFNEEYTHPRNFASGSIRLLDSNECAKRNLTFVAWDVIEGCPAETMSNRLMFCEYTLGFETVPFYTLFDETTDAYTIIEAISKLCKDKYPIDGIVFKFDNIEYGNSKGQTSHHFKNAIAYKFAEAGYETVLRNVEWSMGRTGVLTPVAILEPIVIDSTTVSRASLHNISIMETLGLRYRDTKVSVIKAKEIIPQIAEVMPYEAELACPIEIPEVCPICGEATEIIVSAEGVKELMCTNPQCEGKLINVIDHFASKKGLDIKGLSKATIATLIDQGWLNDCLDIFSLHHYADKWKKLPGFGEKSVEKILAAIETAKNCTLDKFIAALGIPLIGAAQSKELCKHISSYEEFREKIDSQFNFAEYDGFAEAKTANLLNFDYSEADRIYKFLNCGSAVEEKLNASLAGVKVVVTGTVHQFKNRNELAAAISARGGQVVSAISKNVNYLINNDINSTSAKNQAAKRAGIPILSEEEFMKKFDF